jgi:hypothetical protein
MENRIMVLVQSLRIEKAVMNTHFDCSLSQLSSFATSLAELLTSLEIHLNRDDVPNQVRCV